MLRDGIILNERYKLQQKIGENICRQTWTALDLSSQADQKVVLKFLTFGPEMKWDDFRLFEREITTLQHLECPLIPKYLDNFVFEERFSWLVLVHAYIPGESLLEIVERGQKFLERDVRNIIIGILNILIYLHELSPPILHRDIKPSNIILGDDQKIYLVDFGSVQAREAVEGATFTIVGTYGYTPLEQFGGRAVPASDLYALGATLIHLLTGVAPAELPKYNLHIQFRQYLSLPDEFINWVEVLTHPNVEQRFSTARETLRALEKPEIVLRKRIKSNRPSVSKIQFEKNSSRLNIKIPRRGLKAIDGLTLIWIVILYASTIPLGAIIYPFVILYWLVGLMPTSYFLLVIFGYVNLFFDKNRFTIEWRFLGFRYRLLQGYTAIIKDIYPDTSNVTKTGSLDSFEIHIGNQKYNFRDFCMPLSNSESQWLAQELRDWLR